MDTDEENRKVAVNRCVKGEKRIDICKDLNRSKGWFSKWFNRYKIGHCPNLEYLMENKKFPPNPIDDL